jgi:uncharacterized protein (TIGR02118 family)
MIRMTHLLVAHEGDDDLAGYLSSTYLPMLRALPGVQRVEAAVVNGHSMGDVPVRAIADVYFTDEDAMNAAFAAPEGRRVSREVMGGRGSTLEILTCEVLPPA